MPGATAASVVLSSRLRFELDDLGYEFPRYPVPEGETMDSFLANRVAEGIEPRYGMKRNRGLHVKAKKQVAHELSLIARLGFAGYFLIVWDIVRYCKRNGILVQGRGSAANSAVCYCLEITAEHFAALCSARNASMSNCVTLDSSSVLEETHIRNR